MNKYQRFVISRIRGYLATDSNFNENKPLIEFLDDEDNLVITQDENYNIKNRNLMIMSNVIDHVELDGKRIDPVKENDKRNDHYVIIPFNFDKRAKQLKLYFSNGITEDVILNIAFSEADHKIFDSKVQAEINEKIKPEHKTGNDLVNIYWNLVSDEVETTQINLYFVSGEERLIGKYKENGPMFKSITGLAFGTYRYEIIELGKNGEELARTKKIEFKISAPVYGGGKNTVII